MERASLSLDAHMSGLTPPTLYHRHSSSATPSLLPYFIHGTPKGGELREAGTHVTVGWPQEEEDTPALVLAMPKHCVTLGFWFPFSQ